MGECKQLQKEHSDLAKEIFNDSTEENNVTK